MPIYAYQCSACGYAEDVLQRMSDAPLSTCSACGQDTYVKQVTAAGFQLKGSGWYVTDFRDKGGQGGKDSKNGKGDQDKPGSAASDAASSSTPSATDTVTPAASAAPLARPAPDFTQRSYPECVPATPARFAVTILVKPSPCSAGCIAAATTAG